MSGRFFLPTFVRQTENNNTHVAIKLNRRKVVKQKEAEERLAPAPKVSTIANL